MPNVQFRSWAVDIGIFFTFGIGHWALDIGYFIMSLSPDLLEILVCPKCKGDLEYRTQPKEQLVCHTCRLIYTVEDDIPIMLVDEATSF